ALEPAARMLEPTEVVINGGDVGMVRPKNPGDDRERPEIESLSLDKASLVFVDYRQVVQQCRGLEMSAAESRGCVADGLAKVCLGHFVPCVDALERGQAVQGAKAELLTAEYPPSVFDDL